jgi:hypothetical protein
LRDAGNPSLSLSGSVGGDGPVIDRLVIDWFTLRGRVGV